MKKKIYWNICVMALLSLILGTLSTVYFLERDRLMIMRREARMETEYLRAAMETSGDRVLTHLQDNVGNTSVNRITWIGSDGTVYYDSFRSSDNLQNHLERPEVKQALEQGWGETVRLSKTLDERTYYFALRLEDNTVIRVANTTRSSLASMIHTIPLLVTGSILILAITMVLARIQTARIVRPVNELDLDAPEKGSVYAELSPLIRRMEKQNATIRRQIRMLSERQEEFTAITENMKEGFILVDAAAEVVSYNTSAVRILGVDPEQEEAHSWNVLKKNRPASFRKAVQDAIQGMHNEQIMDLNGRYYQIIANPVYDSDDNGNTSAPRGAVVVILDVTEMHCQEELRREFSANVSHELKTPLTSISGYAEIMKNGLVRPEDIPRFSEKIYQEAQRMITLIGDIIRLSRLDEGLPGREQQYVNLYELAQEVLESLKEASERSGVRLKLKGKKAVVQGDPQLLREMVYNLCDNAIKYNRPEGTVTVTAGHGGGKVRLTVEDTGIGIPVEDRQRIFERFYRVDKSHSRQIGGTGLGLSIVKHGAIYHHAEILLDSELGKGTSITLCFPEV